MEILKTDEGIVHEIRDGLMDNVLRQFIIGRTSGIVAIVAYSHCIIASPALMPIKRLAYGIVDSVDFGILSTVGFHFCTWLCSLEYPLPNAASTGAYNRYTRLQD